MIRIYQDVKSLIVLDFIKKFLKCGDVLKPSSGRSVATLVFSDKIGINKIIQLCNEIQLLGSKKKDFIDFCKVYNLFLNKEHLNSSGLNKIVKIVRGMNLGRKFD
jgi:LAGLIDADG endonuclease